MEIILLASVEYESSLWK